jgi:hypothetical protein
MGIGYSMARGAARAYAQNSRQRAAAPARATRTGGGASYTRTAARTAQRPAWAQPAPAAGPPLPAVSPAAQVAVPETRVIQASEVRQPQRQGIDGALLWLLVRKYLQHYVAFRTDAEAQIATAWVFHAVARERDDTGLGPLIWRASPRLLVTSATRGSGKSTLLDLIVILTGSRRGKVPKITPARIAQVLGKYHETVVLDEARTIFGTGSKSLELQGILLAGYTRRTSYEISGKSYSLFGAVAYAGKDELITSTTGEQIGDLLDRSIILRMAPPAKPKPELAEKGEDDGDLLARALVAWTDSMRGELQQAARDIAAEDQEAAEGGNLRSMQISRPLRACARVISPAAEADVCAALDEITAGAAGSEAADIMTQLQERSGEWGDDVLDADAPGQFVTSPGGDEDELDG